MWRFAAIFFALAFAFQAHAQVTKVLPFDGTIVSTSNIPNKTVGTLPACSAAFNGQVYIVTDALLPSLGIAVVGGGAVTVFVVCNATSWLAR